MTSLELCYISAGFFFLIGLLSGVWKYVSILQSEKSEAKEYVSILHRASLLYSFAILLLAQFVKLNPYSEEVRFWCALAVISFFVFAITTYFLHAVLGDTDNQFRKPYILGPIKLPKVVIHGSMLLLILAEACGFGVLFFGYLMTVVK